jgi:hypothetical protein
MDSQINPLFTNALSTGKVVVRRWWVNTQSEKDQISVQFQQEIEKEEDDNSLMAIAQGSSSKQRPTAIYSFKADVAKAHLGSTEGSFVVEGQPVFANDIWGKEINIQVTENFTPNPYSKSHQPKVNPGTGEVVTSFNPETKQDEPVYRHTDLVSGKTENTFISKSQSATSAVFGSVPASLDLDAIMNR